MQKLMMTKKLWGVKRRTDKEMTYKLHQFLNVSLLAREQIFKDTELVSRERRNKLMRCLFSK